MSPEDLKMALELGREQPSVEFKTGGKRTDDTLLAKVIRAALGMANQRDGGVIVLGVGEKDGKLEPSGINAEDLDTWRYDHVCASIAPYVDPSMSFETTIVELDGKQFLVITVREFETIPILCKKHFAPNGKSVLREGGCYVRSRRKIETAEVASTEDMHALLDLAVEKKLRHYVETAAAAGVALIPNKAESDAERFRAQTEKIK